MNNDDKRQKDIKEIQKIYAEIATDDRNLADDFLNICVMPEIKK